MTECFDATDISKRNLNLHTTEVEVASGAIIRILKMDVDEVLNAACVVYIHVNKSNRKCYVGATINSASYRFENGRGYKGQKAFSSAIRYHGWNAFDSHIIAFTDNREQLNTVEFQAIQHIGGHRHNGNYNMSPGGEIVSDNGKPIFAVYLPTLEETYYPSGSEAARTLNIHMDIPADVANKSSKRDYYRDWYFYYADEKPLYPQLWGKHARGLKFRKKRGKPVIVVPFTQPKTKCRFESVIEAANFIGCRQSDVSTVCAGQQISVNGYFCYFESEPRELPNSFGTKARSIKRSSQVWSLDLKQSEGQLVKHESYTEAAKNTGVSQSSVSSIVLGKRKSENGFWFTDDPKRQPPEKGQWGKASVSHSKEIPVKATHFSTGRISQFDSAKEAAETLGLHRSQISRALNSTNKKLRVGSYFFEKR
jgi:hypothetical protein